MLNTVVLQGRLTADPQMRQTTTGKNVSSFCIACDRNRRNADGQSEADFINIVAWNQTAEFICRNFRKGAAILVEGRLTSRNYQDKDGNRRTATEVVANNVYFAGDRRQNNDAAPVPQQSAAAPAQQPAQQYPAAPAAPAADDFSAVQDEGDLPF